MTTLDQYPELIRGIQERLINEISGVALTHGANELMAEMRTRIFTKGLNSDGSPIGNAYSEKPIYVSKDVFIRKGAFTPKGKTSKGNFKNGNERKTMFLEHGYKELRDIQARQTDHVDWRYSGSLEKSIEVVREDERNVLIAITDGDESAKRKGLEERSNQKVFTPSESDMTHYENVMADEIEKIVESIV